MWLSIGNHCPENPSHQPNENLLTWSLINSLNGSWINNWWLISWLRTKRPSLKRRVECQLNITQWWNLKDLNQMSHLQVQKDRCRIMSWISRFKRKLISLSELMSKTFFRNTSRLPTLNCLTRERNQDCFIKLKSLTKNHRLDEQ